MASQFEIEIKALGAPGDRQALVQVIDRDQDETTNWCRVELPCDDASHKVIMAHACLQHAPIAQMLDVARRIAYAVYLNQQPFDIHAFLPTIPVLTSQSGLEGGTPCPVASNHPSPRI